MYGLAPLAGLWVSVDDDAGAFGRAPRSAVVLLTRARFSSYLFIRSDVASSFPLLEFSESSSVGRLELTVSPVLCLLDVVLVPVLFLEGLALEPVFDITLEGPGVGPVCYGFGVVGWDGRGEAAVRGLSSDVRGDWTKLPLWRATPVLPCFLSVMPAQRVFDSGEIVGHRGLCEVKGLVVAGGLDFGCVG